MKKLILLFVLIFSLGLAAATLAQQKPKDFSGVEIIYPSFGSIGIFDKKEGKLYYYDSNYKCVKIAQIDELGKPLLKVELPSKSESGW